MLTYQLPKWQQSDLPPITTSLSDFMLIRENQVLAIFLVLTARSSNAKALPSSAQFLRHRAAVHTAR